MSHELPAPTRSRAGHASPILRARSVLAGVIATVAVVAGATPACDPRSDGEVEGDLAAECTDGVDNDQDGLTDCYEILCAEVCAETADDDDGDDDTEPADDDTTGDDDTSDDDTGDDDTGDDDTTGDDDGGDEEPGDCRCATGSRGHTGAALLLLVGAVRALRRVRSGRPPA